MREDFSGSLAMNSRLARRQLLPFLKGAYIPPTTIGTYAPPGVPHSS